MRCRAGGEVTLDARRILCLVATHAQCESDKYCGNADDPGKHNDGSLDHSCEMKRAAENPDYISKHGNQTYRNLSGWR